MTARKSIPSKNGRSAKRVIMAESGSDATDLLDSLLHNSGVEIVPADTGREAFSLAVQLKPDLIAVRTGLPDVDSVQLCQALFVHPLTADIDVIIYHSTIHLVSSLQHRLPELAHRLGENPAARLQKIFEGMYRLR